MIEFILNNKEALLGLGTALLVIIGGIVRLTSSPSDDRLFNKILGLVGLGRFGVTPPPVVEEPKPAEWPSNDEPTA